jgi:hypothetical protein
MIVDRIRARKRSFWLEDTIDPRNPLPKQSAVRKKRARKPARATDAKAAFFLTGPGTKTDPAPKPTAWSESPAPAPAPAQANSEEAITKRKKKSKPKAWGESPAPARAANSNLGPPLIADTFPMRLEERAEIMFETPPLLKAVIAPEYDVAAALRDALLTLHRSGAPAFKLLFAQALRALDTIGVKIKAGLHPKAPKPRPLQTLPSHIFETSSKGEEVTVDPKVADMIKKFALIAGFVEVAPGVLLATTPEAAMKLFGAKNSLSGRHHLRRLWPAKGQKLTERKSDRDVYAEATAKLGRDALAEHSDSSLRSKPAYVLRVLLDDHISKPLVLDRSLRAASEVDLQRPFTIRLTPKLIPGTRIEVATFVKVRMMWNGTCRHELRGAARPIFTHV